MNRLKLIAVLLLTCAVCHAQDVVTRYSPFMLGTAKPLFLTDWPTRVVANGGALPSANSTNSVNIFYTHLVLTGLTNKLIAVIGFAPDSIIAATTPIYFQAGFPMWTNQNFGASNLTVNGLTGNTTTKHLLTGLNPSTLTAGGYTDDSSGITALIYSSTNTTGTIFGGFGTAANTLNQLAGGGADHMAYYSWLFTSVNAGFVIRPLPHANWSGYISGNRTAADAIRVDAVTNGVFNTYTNAIGTVAGNNNNSITNVVAFARWNPGTPFAGVGARDFGDMTISFLAVHGGLTFTESSNLSVGVFQLRTNLGGGTPQPQ